MGPTGRAARAGAAEDDVVVDVRGGDALAGDTSGTMDGTDIQRNLKGVEPKAVTGNDTS